MGIDAYGLAYSAKRNVCETRKTYFGILYFKFTFTFLIKGGGPF